jgi:hypothetical protein
LAELLLLFLEDLQNRTRQCRGDTVVVSTRTTVSLELYRSPGLLGLRQIWCEHNTYGVKCLRIQTGARSSPISRFSMQRSRPRASLLAVNIATRALRDSSSASGVGLYCAADVTSIGRGGNVPRIRSGSGSNPNVMSDSTCQTVRHSTLW